MKYKNIIFDLDGTLTDSGPGIRNAVRHALFRFGIEENDTANLNRFIGPPLYDSFVRFYNIDAVEAHKGENYFREYYRDKGIYENSLYDGIKECLEKLCKLGRNLYIGTSKPDFMAEIVVNHFDIKKYFTGIYGARIEEGLYAKSDVLAKLFAENTGVLKEDSIMVGDREHDIFGAKTIGISSVGVLWGYGSRDEFLSSGADFVIETPKELTELISRIAQ